MSEILGRSFIGAERGAGSEPAGTAFDPTTGEALAPTFVAATAAEVERAAELARAASPLLAALPGLRRGALLRTIAAELEARGEEIKARAGLETALPPARLGSELGRTTGQLRAFAALVEEGSWVDARIDRGQPERQPLPRPDLRSRLWPLGPVAVFGASNFPLAFSVAGGDTAAALAAGCPVVAVAHPAHPGTAELAAGAIRAAVEAEGLPAGTFSLLVSRGTEAGQALVRHPALAAVAFTGSRRGGLALTALAEARPRPIPVFAEMGSVNPVVLLPGAVAERRAALAEGLFGSMTLGCGQFCTQPGLIFVPAGVDGEILVADLRSRFAQAPALPLLSAAIAASYAEGTAKRSALPAVTGTEGLPSSREGRGFWVRPTLHTTTACVLRVHPELTEEVFGPTSVVVTYRDVGELTGLLAGLEGQLTATVHAAAGELEAHPALFAELVTLAGRVVVNGFPTGVEVAPAMVHGGPYPATSDGRSTSVGTAAIERFTRRIAYQNTPDALLPPELLEGNPLQLRRLVDGRWE